VGAFVHRREDGLLAADLFRQVHTAENVEAHDMLCVHADNGGPMKGATL
jgi:hypothetical protein